ncbi:MULTISPECIES: acyl-CoA dehydrogenase family protein [unclassified Ruegeria]|uniref:acyl-CoA dehydrogenase family protein n=1 Tax=unclassified Ruegeria TaxID=2625375 RepID=UPI0014893B9E|nr:MULTISPECIES: acyl-CoA dehydrogenase family protein [unclassified Ruegeria]
MDLSFTPEEEAFRAEVKAFLAENLSEALAAKGRNGEELTKADMEGWHATLQTRNWLAATWPVEYGGPGWSAVERHIFEEECAMAFAPRIVAFGVSMLGPVLLKFGSDAQKAEFLPRILDGTHWWCQGYSEPGAGSDLASLKTRADRDGDHYVINGQKTWTTLGQHADKIFCLVRTSSEGKPQEGISFVLVDMNTPGIEVRPIKLLEGGHEVNEVFFTDVRVPVANLVGEENKGWTIAKYLLTHERTNIAGVGFSLRDLDRLKRLSKQLHRMGKPLAEDPVFAAEIAEVEIDLEAMRVMNLAMLSAAKEGAAPGMQSSMLKIKGTVIRQRIHGLTKSALGAAAAPFPATELSDNARTVPEEATASAATYFNNRKLSIFGGSNEIQRNIIAKDMFRS